MVKIIVGKRLAWFKDKADNPIFWEKHWESKTNVFKELEKARKGCRGLNKRIFKKWIPKILPVLDGGCGIGIMVMALQSMGYDIIGIDFSIKTIQRSKKFAPDLSIEHGDIFNLNFPDNSFGAYISLGVVEHYFEGPDKAFKEAYRVIKPGGVFICSIPYFSPIRKLRAFMGDYFSSEMPDKDSFYQYAFTKEEFSSLLISSGFTIVDVYFRDPVLGARKELWGFERLYSLGPGIIWKVINRINLGKSILGHMITFVAVKKVF